jgi:capsular exopolysaccharide synthesis family protein
MKKAYEALQWSRKARLAAKSHSTSDDHSGTSRELFPWVSPSVAMQDNTKLPKAANAEEYEKIRTSMLRYADGTGSTIMFSSCSEGDGVSTSAAHFAIAMAKSSQAKVLLLEANLRSPSLGNKFDSRYGYDLLSLLCKYTEAPENSGDLLLGVQCVSNRRFDNLFVIPCHKRCIDPMSVLNSAAYKGLFSKMRKRFDYVIVDAPPVHGSPECLVLAPEIDGVVMVIKSAKTRGQVARNAKQQIEDAGAKLLGVVLNMRQYHIPECIYKRL